MKYEKCPICEEKLRNGVCPMCGYDFNRLGRSRILKDGHWDILTTDKKTSQPKYIHDEKRHPDFKNIKNTKTQSMKTQRKTSTYKNKKEKKIKMSALFSRSNADISIIHYLISIPFADSTSFNIAAVLSSDFVLSTVITVSNIASSDTSSIFK